MDCPQCGSRLAETQDKCYTCGYYSPPNVRVAQSEEEILALDQRYENTCLEAQSSGCLGELQAFEQALGSTSAVVNMSLRALFHFVSEKTALYQNYSLSVEGQSRKAAEPEDDRMRHGVEALLFGSYFKEIRYAALSLGGAGLESYGPFSVVLRDVAVSTRATLLEENSYTFVTKHNLAPGRKIPAGYRSTWSRRNRLAVAKLGSFITGQTTPAEFPGILLKSDGINKAADEFIEVHVYGAFDFQAVQEVRTGYHPKNAQEKALLEMTKEKVAAAGKTWTQQ